MVCSHLALSCFFKRNALKTQIFSLWKFKTRVISLQAYTHPHTHPVCYFSSWGAFQSVCPHNQLTREATIIDCQPHGERERKTDRTWPCITAGSGICTSWGPGKVFGSTCPSATSTLLRFPNGARSSERERVLCLHARLFQDKASHLGGSYLWAPILIARAGSRIRKFCGRLGPHLSGPIFQCLLRE